jgi:hypothetical protein
MCKTCVPVKWWWYLKRCVDGSYVLISWILDYDIHSELEDNYKKTSNLYVWLMFNVQLRRLLGLIKLEQHKDGGIWTGDRPKGQASR